MKDQENVKLYFTMKIDIKTRFTLEMAQTLHDLRVIRIMNAGEKRFLTTHALISKR